MLNLAFDTPQAVEIVSAIHRGDVEAVKRHLRDTPALASARIVDASGVSRSLLHIVADWPGHFPNGSAMVATLVAAGADVNAALVHQRSHGSAETPLHWAASSDDVAVLDALLDGGADIEATGAVFTGGTPMSDAVVFAQWRAARRLLERGAATTIWQAAALGLIERVRELCGTEPPPTPRDLTNACWNACRGGQQAIAAFLIDRGADLNWVGHDGKTPRDVAREGGHDDLDAWLDARGGKRAADLV